MAHKPLHIQELPDQILSPEEDAQIRAEIDQAEEDPSARYGEETRVDFHMR